MFYDVFGTFDLTVALQIVLKVLLSIFLGGLVGLEREWHNMPAGVRTFILVSVGSCMFTILSYRFGGDPARVAAQIVTGIGFLGAGVVMQHKGTVHGLTSAAGIWAVAAVGMAVGSEDYFMAILGTVAIFVVLGLLRQLFKASLLLAPRRTLNVSLFRVRVEIVEMGNLVGQAVRNAIRAVVQDNHVLARQIVEGDERVNQLRYQIEEDCLDILRTHHPGKTQLRTVLAANHIATDLERVGDYGKEIAQICLQMRQEPLLTPLLKTPPMADRVCDMLQRVLIAFSEDDVEAARGICAELQIVDKSYHEIVRTVTEMMGQDKSGRAERGTHLLNVAYYLKRVGERVTNIAERAVFVRTGTLAELAPEEAVSL